MRSDDKDRTEAVAHTLDRRAQSVIGGVMVALGVYLIVARGMVEGGVWLIGIGAGSVPFRTVPTVSMFTRGKT